MKTFILMALSLLFTRVANAQKSLLSLDEHDKYIYYQVVEMPGFSADSLAGNAAWFVKTTYPKNSSVQRKAGEITAADKFLTYTAVIKHESGAIAYSVTIECKDQKYRYWLTNFIFTPYGRDRYSTYLPKPGVEIPLEKTAEKFDKKDVEGYLNQTGAFCKQFGDKLKIAMVNSAPKKEEAIKKIVTDKW